MPAFGKLIGVVDDLEALQRWRQGDRAAGELLFGRYFDRLFRFFCAKLDDATAEDVTQATFLACVRGQGEFRGDASFRTYLFAVERNQLLMHFRSRSRSERVIELGEVSAADLGASPSTMLRATDEQRVLREAMHKLPIDFQIAVELYYWEDMTTVEIADVLGVPEGTVRSRLARSRERLAELIRAGAEDPEVAGRTIEGLDTIVGSLVQLPRR